MITLDVGGTLIIAIIFIILAIWFLVILPKRNKILSIEDLQTCFNRIQCREAHSHIFQDFPMPDASARTGYTNVRYCPICEWSADISTQGFLFEKYIGRCK